MTTSPDELQARVDSAIKAVDFLDASLTRIEKMNPVERDRNDSRLPDAHKALRLIYNGTPLTEDLDKNATYIDLVDLIWDALDEISSSRKDALAASPSTKEPLAEYERLLIVAEQAALASSMSAQATPADRARALAEVAGRWIQPDFLAARKRAPQAGVTYFGSPSGRTQKAVELEEVLHQFHNLNLRPLAGDYLRAAVKLSASGVPVEALELVARIAARGRTFPDELELLEGMITTPFREVGEAE